MSERVYSESGGVQRHRAGKPRLSDSGMPYPVMPTRADAKDKWESDLFESGSTLYEPKVAYKAAKPAASTSLRPFGQATPNLEPMSNEEKRNRPSVVSRSQSDSSLSLFDRISGMGKAGDRSGARSTGPYERDGPAPEAAGNSLAARMGLVKLAREGKQRQERRQRERGSTGGAGIKGAARAAEQAQQQQSAGSLVVVQNLVAGTTADDVRAAFSEFGTILECNVKKMANKSLFSAEVLFKVLAEAESARSTLDGVLADGEKLSVTIVPTGPASRPPRNDVNGGSAASRLGAPTGRSAEARAQSLMGPPVTEGKLHSDLVLATDPRASVITDPHATGQYRGRPSSPRKNRHYNRRNNGMDLD